MDGSRRSDEQLLAATKADPLAFGEFYRRHEEAMLVYVLRRTSKSSRVMWCSADSSA